MSAITVASASNQVQQQQPPNQSNQTGMQQSTTVSSSSTAASSTKVTGTDASSSAIATAGQSVPKPIELDKIYQWINELCMPATRENALVELRYSYSFHLVFNYVTIDFKIKFRRIFD